MNTDRHTKTETRAEIINKFINKLSNSGYGEKYREEIVKSGLTGYYHKVDRENKGGEPINRDANRNRAGKKIAKMIRKVNWLQPKEKRIEGIGENKEVKD